jgi:hypothetical protein
LSEPYGICWWSSSLCSSFYPPLNSSSKVEMFFSALRMIFHVILQSDFLTKTLCIKEMSCQYIYILSQQNFWMYSYLSNFVNSVAIVVSLDAAVYHLTFHCSPAVSVRQPSHFRDWHFSVVLQCCVVIDLRSARNFVMIQTSVTWIPEKSILYSSAWRMFIATSM